jgi:DNA repair protein RecN (Recombination protein N)
MPGTELKVQQADADDAERVLSGDKGGAPQPAAVLKGEFHISTNVGQRALPLAKIASGGELSRIMLAIKVRQKTSQEGTLLFDEIDSGISGQTAFMIAQRLKELSAHAQAVWSPTCTRLPRLPTPIS